MVLVHTIVGFIAVNFVGVSAVLLAMAAISDGLGDLWWGSEELDAACVPFASQVRFGLFTTKSFRVSTDQ